MEASPNTCFICKEALPTKDAVVVTRGLDTLIRSSLRRQDGKHSILQNVSSITVHSSCRKDYTRESSIVASCLNSPQKVKKLRSHADEFDFKLHCLFCGKDCDAKADTKLSSQKRARVSEVQTLESRSKLAEVARRRNDSLGSTVEQRVLSVVDLPAVEARYHRTCYANFFKCPTDKPPGRPESEGHAEAFEKLFDFLDNSNECQHPINDLQAKLEEFLPSGTKPVSVKWLKKKLEEHFGEDVIITSLKHRSPIVCLRGTGHKIITDAWYEQRLQNSTEERLRIVKTAADIIKQDISATPFVLDQYPPADDILSTASEVIALSLSTFLEHAMTRRHQANSTDLTRKCVVLSHAIMTALRPRSFLSSVQLATGVCLHKEFGSRILIDLLNSMGVCASYNEIIMYEESAKSHGVPKIKQDSFQQFVFDNADFNVRTTDGFGTFHCMGGINCVTPASAVLRSEPMPRLKMRVPTPAQNTMILQTYQHGTSSGLNHIKIEDVTKLRSLSSPEQTPQLLDDFWMISRQLYRDTCPNWSGFMELMTNHTSSYETSRVVILPFINLQPTSMDAIYTALTFASKECNTTRQTTCMVTFDQPLYIKACDIVKSSKMAGEQLNVVVRLGGFHLLMSFMGSIGYMMRGSGLEELWSSVYASHSIEKMTAGHAYARALRAHFLTQLAIAHIIFQKLSFSEAVLQQVSAIGVTDDLPETQLIADHPVIGEIGKEIKAFLTTNSAKSRTANLWSQYFTQVQLLRFFIRAERTGNWDLHLYSVKQMLPHFHAAGHLAYAKSAHLYLQQMSDLVSQMDPMDYQQFTTEGFFTVRRSDKFWAGIWTDMTIEQVLMRTMKASGGLTHGRGVTANVVSKWVLSMPAASHIRDCLESFCGVKSHSSEQHVELRQSTQLRDCNVVNKFVDWFTVHNPFPEKKELMSIATGVVGNETINCDNAVTVGMKAMEAMTGKTFGDIQLKRTDKVLPLASMDKSVRIRDEIIPVNSMQLFNRIICVVKSDKELASIFSFELAPMPLSLFDGGSMRKSNKSVLYDVFTHKPEADPKEVDAECRFVIDGGFLLHRVVWPQHGTYIDLYQLYVCYVLRHFGTNSTVVFDGYGAENCTKNTERQRRSIRSQSATIHFNSGMVLTSTQEKFLANSDNKRLFIKELTAHFISAGVNVKQATSDADTLIVKTAVDFSNASSQHVVVVAEDIDLLILLVVHANPPQDITFRKPGRGKQPSKEFSSKTLQECFDEVRGNLLFLHAVTGCDTTSALYRQGKKKGLKLLQKRKDLCQKVAVFNAENADTEAILYAGEAFLLALYGAPETVSSLDDYRYLSYTRAVAKSQIHTKVQLASLPPTRDAARQHILRVYHQVQQWHGHVLSAADFGWRLRDGILTPVPMTVQPAPDKLLNIISCNCKKGCERGCGCSKVGIPCSSLCGHCRGVGCSNATSVEDDEEEAEPDDVSGSPDLI